MILVTGGLGFIGTHTTRALLDVGAEVLPASRTPAPSALLPRELATVAVDCTDRESLFEVGRRHRITAIVHLAAVALGHTTPLEELRENMAAVFAVLQAAAEWNVERVVLASTIGVYAGVEQVPWREDTTLPVASPHPIPAAKKLAEIAALASGVDVVTARIGGIYGPLGRPVSRFIAAPALIHAAARVDAAATDTPREGAGGDGIAVEARRLVSAAEGADILYAPDCGAALALLATAARLRHRVYNIGAGRATTNGEVAEAISAVLPDAVPGVTGEASGAASTIPHMDNARLLGEGWAPQWPVRRAVSNYLAWLAAGNPR